MKITTISFLVSKDGVYLSEKKRGFGTGYLNGYGGKALEGESIENAAVRELNEEAGLTVLPQKLEKVALIDFFEGDEHIFECHVFFAREWEGELKESEEMAYPLFYKFTDLPYDRMWKSDRVWLPLVFSGEKIKAKAWYEKGMDEMKHFEHGALL
jgi:8-oxo-dGTP diphosphatase